MTEMPDIPAVPPPGAQIRVQVADMDAGTITDLGTGQVTALPGPPLRLHRRV